MRSPRPAAPPSPDPREVARRRLAELTSRMADAPPAAGGAVARPWWADHTVPVDRRPATPDADPAHDPTHDPSHQRAEPPRAPLFQRPSPVRPPGRHAARRPLAPAVPSTARDSIPGGQWESLRIWLGPAQVAVLAVVVALGLAATTWWVVRSDPEPAPAPSLDAAAADPLADLGGDTSPAAATPSSGAAAVDPSGSVTVDVAGEVRRPGIAVLDAGARVVDALEAAGGARPGVDLSGLNLARPLVDGEQIVVGGPATAPPAVPPPSGAPPSTSGSAPTSLVNINLADQVELETLPEVGPVTAQAIIAWRDQNGGFTAVEELLEVDGIGDATLAQMAPYVTI